MQFEKVAFYNYVMTVLFAKFKQRAIEKVMTLFYQGQHCY